MNLRLQLRMMLAALLASGTRAALALTAVALAIAAVMLMLAAQTGARRELEEIADRMGKNLFMVRAGQVLPPPGRGGWYTSDKLRREDVALLRREIPEVREIVPILEASRPVAFGGKQIVTSVRGVTPEFLALRNFQVEEGRSLEETDQRDRVAVAGAFIAKRLNDGFPLVGETILIAGIPFKVVGQLREKGMTADGQNEDDQILIPLETARRRVFNAESLSRLLVQVDAPEHILAVQNATRALLRRSHDLGEGTKDDFEILGLVRVNMVRQMSADFVATLTRLFALVTLAVGGAGVLAVTYLNAKERTPEIGLRIAVGARPRDIAALFVAEACLLSVVGGLGGVVVGGIAALVLGRVAGWGVAVDGWGVGVPLGVSVVLGLMFSVGPAVRASRIVPVEALRGE